MIAPYRHISFDLDGTLVHTKADYRYAIVPIVVRELGGMAESEAIDTFWFGADRDEVIRERFGVDPQRFWSVFNKHDSPEQRDGFTRVYPEVIPALKRINNLGKTVSIITGAPSWIAKMETAKLEGVEIAHMLATDDSPIGNKPCPEAMHHVLRSLGHKPNETLYIGNGKEDELFAEAAGCDFIRIDRKEHAFNDWNPKRSISSLEELFLKPED